MTVLVGAAFPVPLHQPAENVRKIEIFDTSLKTEKLLYTLDETEIPAFMDQLQELKAGKFVNDPILEYGIVAVRITYADGYADTLGPEHCDYLSPSGEDKARGWYYMDEDLFLELIARYVDSSLIEAAAANVKLE